MSDCYQGVVEQNLRKNKQKGREVLKKPLRKLTTVLIADVQGYTRLMENDENFTRLSVTRHRENFTQLTKRFEGKVLDKSGDSIFAEYSSSQNAVECAVEFQLQCFRENLELQPDRKMEFRIGMNAGDVLDDGISIYGDAVNTAARLQELSSPGGICVSSVLHDLVDGRVEFQFQFLREQKVKNKRRSVRVYQLQMESLLSNSVKTIQGTETKKTRLPSIAVLPFQNLAGDDSRQYLGDGLAEDITIELSRFDSINVLAKTTAFSYRDQSSYISKLFQDQGVQFVLEGSVRAVDDRIRISAQLVECRTAKQIWADRYTRQASAIFEVQDEVVGLIVSMLEGRLNTERLKNQASLYPVRHKAYDFWLRGKQLLEEGQSSDTNRCLELFQQAVALDGNFARAYASMASIYLQKIDNEPGIDSFHHSLDLACRYSQTAVRLDPADARAHIHLGWSYMLQRKFSEARHHYDVAGNLNPGDANILIARSRAYAYLDDVISAQQTAKHSLLLNPQHPDYYADYLGAVFLLCGKVDEATKAFSLSKSLSYNGRFFQIASLVQQTRKRDTDASMTKLLDEIADAWVDTKSADEEHPMEWLMKINPLKTGGILVDSETGFGLLNLPIAHSKVS
ncbi:MAG: adenylate cyclase [Gammaproteobacteria bacterium]